MPGGGGSDPAGTAGRGTVGAILAAAALLAALAASAGGGGMACLAAAARCSCRTTGGDKSHQQQHTRRDSPTSGLLEMVILLKFLKLNKQRPECVRCVQVGATDARKP